MVEFINDNFASINNSINESYLIIVVLDLYQEYD